MPQLAGLETGHQGRRFWAKITQSDLVINNILMIALLILGSYFAINSKAFFSLSNFEIILTNYAAIGVIAAVMTLLMIAGHVDLSVGSNVAFSGTIAAIAATKWGLPGPSAAATAILAGACIGAVNGFLCGVLRFSPVIVTLGTLGILRGTILLIEPSEIYGLGPTFDVIGNGRFLGVPILLIVVLAVFLASGLFLSLTTWGRYVYAIGINPNAAFLAALPVRALPFALYVATGAAAGGAGLLLISRLDGSSPGALGLQMELQTLTIVLLGGVAFAGGRGRMSGVITAWVFLGMMENGLTLLNVTPFVQLVAGGLALVFAAALDTLGSVLRTQMIQRRQVADRVRDGSGASEGRDSNSEDRTSEGGRFAVSDVVL